MLMRKALCRVASTTAGVVLAALLVPIGAASAATSDDCDAATSTKLLTGGLFGNTTDHLWVDHPSSTRTVICFQFNSLSVGGLTVIADVASGATPPNVVVGDNPNLCPNVVATLSDPVTFRLAVALTTNAVCLTLGSSTLTVEVIPGNIDPGNLPVFEVWRDGGDNWGWIDVAACPLDWALAVAFGVPTSCMSTNDRVFP